MKKLILSLFCLSIFFIAQAQLQVDTRTVSFGTTVNKKTSPLNKSLVSCSNDTIEYTLAKATSLESINVNNASSAQALSQYFNAPQAITIYGTTFYGWKPDLTNGHTMNMTVDLYLAGLDSMPTGAPLATGTLLIDTTFGTGTLGELEKNITFSTPVTVTQPYVIVVGNYSATPMSLVCNSWTAGDGAQEWLAGVDLFGSWTRSYNINVGPSIFDADPLFLPHVSYDLDADFTANPLYFNTPSTNVTFTDNSSPILQDRMYNIAAFQALTNLSYTYDFGDGNPVVNAINTNNTYAVAQPYTVTLSDTLYGWRTTCTSRDTVMLNTPSDLVITEIMYNPPESGVDSLEFIEIYNNGSTAVDLTNFYFSQGVSHTFTSGIIAPNSYFVICVDGQAFNNVFGFAADAVWNSGGLSNNGEDITLNHFTGFTIDSVDFDDGGIWPSGSALGEPDGGGSSIILCDVNTDNNIGSNWSKSTFLTGDTINGFPLSASPGAANFCCPVLSSSITSTICNNDSIVVNGTTYNANNPSGTETLKTAPNNCDSIVTINLTVLADKTGSITSTICNNDSVVVNGTTYNAGNPTGTEVFTNVGPNNCDSTVTVNLSFHPALTGAVSNTICDGDSVIVNGTTYNAGNPTGTEVFTNVGPNGCDSIVTVNLNVLPALTGTITQIICFGDSIVVNGTTYNTTVTGATEIFTNIGPNSCDSIVTINLTVNPAIDNTVTNAAPTLTANQNGASYRWLDCDNNFAVISSATNQSYTATVAGNYAVEITIGSCIDTSACENVTTTGINVNNGFSRINIYPNPTNSIINISLGSMVSDVNLTLTAVEGKIVYQANNVSENTVRVDISNNSKGIYFLKVETNNQSKVYKVIKE